MKPTSCEKQTNLEQLFVPDEKRPSSSGMKTVYRFTALFSSDDFTCCCVPLLSLYEVKLSFSER